MPRERWSADKRERLGTWGLSVHSAPLFCKLKGALKKNLLIKQTGQERGGGKEGLTLVLAFSSSALCMPAYSYTTSPLPLTVQHAFFPAHSQILPLKRLGPREGADMERGGCFCIHSPREGTQQLSSGYAP